MLQNMLVTGPNMREGRPGGGGSRHVLQVAASNRSLAAIPLLGIRARTNREGCAVRMVRAWWWDRTTRTHPWDDFFPSQTI